MKSVVWFVWLMLIAVASASGFAALSAQRLSGKGESMITITIVYDNNPFRSDLRTAWGFGCLIEGFEKTILFDTGGDGKILLSNMEKLGLSPDKIDVVFLSHIHQDHTGGLDAVLEKNHDVTVFLPSSFPEKMKSAITSRKAKVVEVKKPQEVCGDVFSTGELRTFIKEQSLYARVKGGIAVITGCAHPGIVKIVSRARELSKAQPSLVMGGFHMAGARDTKINSVISDLKQLGVSEAAPCHCSGDRTREMFQQAFGSQFIKAGAGTVIKLELDR